MQIRNMKPMLSTAVLATAISAVIHPAMAADLALEEIIVTAQKREQSLQDVPISVSVKSGAELAMRNENEISSLAKLSPGFTIKDGSSDNERAIQIRGVGTQTFSRAVDQSVSVVVDGVVSTTGGTSLLDFSDIERVEVLRGPQGMLFGKNASAGLLNVVTAKPHQDFDLGFGASFGDLNERKFNGFVNGGLTDSLASRLSFYSNKRDAVYKNDHPVGSDYNDRDEWGVRLQFAYDFSDELSGRLIYNHAERDAQTGGSAVEVGIDARNGDYPASLIGPEADRMWDNNDSIGETDIDTISIELNYDFGEDTLTSISAYSDTSLNSTFRAFQFGETILPFNDGMTDVKQFTQELRITSPGGEKVDYQYGLYYFDKALESSSFQAVDAFWLFGAGGAPERFYLASDKFSEADIKSYAAFGQATWNFTDTTRVTAGLRLQREDIDLEVSKVTPNIPPAVMFGPFGGPNGMVTDSLTDNALSWRFILEQDVTPDAMVYATVARGYKGPAANTLSSVIGGDLLGVDAIIDPEIPTNYEIGIKSKWWDNRVLLNATVFYTEFEDFHAELADQTSGVGAFFLSNVDKMITQGLELEMQAQVTENLSLSANAAIIDATYDSFEGGKCFPGQTPAQGCVGGVQDLSGKDTPNSPDWSYTVSARYERDLTNLGMSAYALASYYRQDEDSFSTTQDPLATQDAYGLLDLTLGVTTDDGRYRVQLWVKNLLDDFWVTGKRDFGLSGARIVHTLDYAYKRRGGISFTYSY